MLRRLTAILFLLLPLAPCAPALAQQPVTTRYVYDANGRLRAVITPDGAAVYDYDAAGNFTAIRNLGPNACEALEFTPRQGPPGTVVKLFGIGLAQATAVTFNGKAAEIVSKTATAIEVKVPDSAESGPLVVTLPCGTKTFTTPFILSGIRITPATIAVSPNRTVQYMAVVAGVIDPGVIWSVGGIVGGNESVGMISESGRYTAPAQAPNTSSTQLIRATSVVEPSIFGEAQARVTGSGYEFLAQGVSVRYGTPPNLVVAYTATPVAVRYGPPDTKGAAFVAAPVAVRYGDPPKEARTYVAAPVSVQYDSATNSATAIIQSLVSVTRSASITSLSTTSLKRGATVTLTVQGKNFTPESTINFLREDGEVEVELRVTEIRVNAEGTVLKAKISVSENALPGTRIIRVTSAFGTTAGNRANTIEILH